MGKKKPKHQLPTVQRGFATTSIIKPKPVAEVEGPVVTEKNSASDEFGDKREKEEGGVDLGKGQFQEGDEEFKSSSLKALATPSDFVPVIHQLTTDQLKLAKRYQSLATKKLEILEGILTKFKSRNTTHLPGIALESRRPDLYLRLVTWAKDKQFLVNLNDGMDSDDEAEEELDVKFTYPHLPFAPPLSRQTHRPVQSKAEAEVVLSGLYEAELYGERRGFSKEMIRSAIAYLGPRCTVTALVDYILLHLASDEPKSVPVEFRDRLLRPVEDDKEKKFEILTNSLLNLTLKEEQKEVVAKVEPKKISSPIPEPLPVNDEPSSDDDYDFMLDSDITAKYSSLRLDCDIYTQLLKQLAGTPLEEKYSPNIRRKVAKMERCIKVFTSALFFNAKEAKYHTQKLYVTRLERGYELKQAISPTLELELKQIRESGRDSGKSKNTGPKNALKPGCEAPVKEEEPSSDEEPPFAFDALFEEAEPSSAKAEVVPKRSPENSISLVIPAGWTGQTPRDLLLGFSKSKKADIKISTDKSTTVAKVVVVERTTVSAPATHTFLSSDPLSPGLPQTKVDAENLVATIALFKLDWLSSVAVLPPPFQDLFSGWRQEDRMTKDLAAHNELLERYDFLSATLIPPGNPVQSKPAIQEEIVEEAEKKFVKKPYWSQRDLNKTFLSRAQNPGYRALFAQRKELPMYSFRTQLLESLAEPGRVVLVVGETGCGKTTQVPQFLVEHAAARNEPCRVVCTQPRRISAVSVAQRVSQELGDSGVGTSGSLVGYQIRLASRTSASNLLVFCTLGVLLRRLEKDPEFNDLTHLVIDEIQERSLDSDFLLVLVRRILSQNTHLRVVLMSATVDANLFSSYFDNCPVLSVPGRTFPVQVHHLESIVRDTGYVLDSGSHYARRELSTRSLAKRATPSDPVMSTLSLMRNDIINNELIIHLLLHISNSATLPEGAILIFLPGVPEIKLLHSQIAADPVLGDIRRFLVLQAHSGVPPDQQTDIFASCPAPLRKVVLATNVAETGITIPDATIVIDTGRMKQIQRDRKLQVSQLLEVDVAQANAKQRMGRAGRVRPGVCFRLFTLERYTQMLPYQTPEMGRLPLEELCLRIKVLGLSDIAAFLAQTIHPPPQEAVSASISLLQEVGAIDKFHDLTPLGMHLSRLPVSVHIGKVMIYGALFRCIDPALTFAAVMSYKSPFVAQINPKFSAAHCDFLSLYSAYSQWRDAMTRGMSHALTFCTTHGLSLPILMEIEEMKQQYLTLLIDAGFVTFANDPPTRRLHRDLCHTPSSFNSNSHMDAVVKCTLVAGLYPKLLTYDPQSHTLTKPPILIRPQQRLSLTATLKTTLTRPHLNLPTPIPSFNSIHHRHFSLPPDQVPTQLLPPPNYRYAIYSNLMKGKRALHIESLSLITPLPILLFARDLTIVHDLNLIVADSAILIKCPSRSASAIMQVRLEVGRCLERLVSNPNFHIESDFLNEEESSHTRLLTLLVDLLNAEE